MGKRIKSHYLYSVWDNRTDQIVCAFVHPRDAATAIGVKVNSFYCYVKRGERACKRWHIEKTLRKEVEEDE